MTPDLMSAVAVSALDADQARRLTERIRLTARTFAESRDKLMGLVEEAKAGSAHVALGYASWTAYLSDVLGDEPLRLARDDRRELVSVLAGEGMSTRAIAPIVGTSHKTVVQDLQSQVVPEVPPAHQTPESPPRQIEGRDGKTYTPPAPRPPANVDVATGEIADPAPRSTPRRPLPEQVKAAGWELRKSIERLERLAADDRFTTAMAPHLRGHLEYALQVCQDLHNRLTNH